MQRALLAALLLAVAGGLLGTWIVLRRLAFFAHAVGSATFPGLVVAGPWGIAAAARRARRRARLRGPAVAHDAPRRDERRRRDRAAADRARSRSAAILASDVYRSGAGVDRLLFGTLLGLGDGDLVARRAPPRSRPSLATAALARTWLATGFDPAGARGARRAAPRAATGCCSRCSPRTVVAVLPAVGALLVSTLLVVPAATARLLTGSLRRAARRRRRARRRRGRRRAAARLPPRPAARPGDRGRRRRRVRARRARGAAAPRTAPRRARVA